MYATVGNEAKAELARVEAAKNREIERAEKRVARLATQQSQTQLGRLLVPGMARPFLLGAVGYHTMAQIAPKNRIMVRNSVERPAGFCLRRYP